MRIWLITGRRALRVGLVLVFVAASVVYIGFSRTEIAVFNPGTYLEATPSSQGAAASAATAAPAADKVVALTIDTSWGGDRTKLLLQTLRQADARATFFVVGLWVDKYPDGLLLIDEAGHEIGNHSNTHPHMRNMEPEQVEAEISLCNRKITDITGKPVTLFRSPYDEYDGPVLEICQRMGMTAVHWDVDAFDWQDLGPEQICAQVVDNVQDKSVVLMHMSSEYVVDALPLILRELKARGYRFVTVSELSEMPPLPLT